MDIASSSYILNFLKTVVCELKMIMGSLLHLKAQLHVLAHTGNCADNCTHTHTHQTTEWNSEVCSIQPWASDFSLPLQSFIKWTSRTLSHPFLNNCINFYCLNAFKSSFYHQLASFRPSHPSISGRFLWTSEADLKMSVAKEYQPINIFIRDLNGGLWICSDLHTSFCLRFIFP